MIRPWERSRTGGCSEFGAPSRKAQVPIQYVAIAYLGPSPGTEAAQKEREEKLRTALDQLTPQEREVLAWRQEGMTYKKIGVRLGVTHVTACLPVTMLQRYVGG